MDNFERLQQRAFGYALLMQCIVIGSFAGVWFFADRVGLSPEATLLSAAAGALIITIVTTRLLTAYLLQPLRVLWQVILHVDPDSNSVEAPNVAKLQLGRELVMSLANRVYQFAGQQQGSKDLDSHRTTVLQAVNVVSRFPLPLFVFNKDLVVTNASDSALSYLNLESSQLFGQQLFESVNLEFPSERTLQTWIRDCQENKVSDHAYWQRVRVVLHDGTTIKQCDIAAHYNRDNQSGTEFIVTLFDHSESYGQDDQKLSFIALAVHELRTPLTMLRGYVEALEEEIAASLNPEMQGYLRKLRLSADQMNAFVNSILNVVKVEGNQLSMHLVEANWPNILQSASASIQSRAREHGINITFTADPNLPTVAVDPVSISEVIGNLLDNAIKYSGNSKEIAVTVTTNKDGMIETSVQDHGVGIPESVLPNIFDKFYRNHRTRSHIGGTGLGLFLAKAVVTAHGGQVWVKSKAGEGSTFTFTLSPYASLAEELKNSDNGDIVRHAHGWIKNHSLYRQ